MAVPSDSLTQVAPQTEGDQPPLDETRIASRWGIVFTRFRHKRLAMFGLVMLVLLFVLAFVGPYLSQWTYTDHDFEAFLQGPSVDHWFGTTQTGGDVYALTLRGMQKSLIIGLLVALFSTGLAAVVGSFAGYFGGWVDRALMWFVDLLLVLPAFLIIAILSPTFRGKTWLVFVILLAAFLWMVTARIVRGMTISLREREYVMAARYMGVPSAMSVPSETSGGCTPKPKYDRPVSEITAAETLIVASTMSSDEMFGRMWRKMILCDGTPI